MNILITGATGFIGSRLALRHLQGGASVRILAQENNAAESEHRRLLEARGAEVAIASVTDRDRVLAAVRGIDVVYHLAAAQHEANIPDRRFWDVNVRGTEYLLEASVAAGVSRFVHGSTIGVYGSALDGRLDEQSPVQPDNIYGVTKFAAETRVLAFREQLPVVIIRIAETYGPGDRRLLKLFKAIQRKVCFVIGSGNNLHHPVYIDDLVEGLCLAATVKDAVGQVFVLPGKEPLTTAAMLETIARQLSTRIPAFHLPMAMFLAAAIVLENTCRPLGIQPPLHRRRLDFFRKNFVFSQERSATLLGFTPRIGFEQGVAETAEWYKARGDL
ncbi:MAG TPA: NAD-dependent epimerase/dehydratase family protein [Alphaproteobacteria bacterium]|nr:NAD-dependent epimerase/dehydratase family protein [Alphaproteobacteria bacterium]